jgi:hypothetical protein
MPWKLTLFVGWLSVALERQACLPKRERRTALALYRELCRQGYEGSYSRVTDFIRAWRREHGKSGRSAFVHVAVAASSPTPTPTLAAAVPETSDVQPVAVADGLNDAPIYEALLKRDLQRGTNPPTN